MERACTGVPSLSSMYRRLRPVLFERRQGITRAPGAEELEEGAAGVDGHEASAGGSAAREVAQEPSEQLGALVGAAEGAQERDRGPGRGPAHGRGPGRHPPQRHRHQALVDLVAARDLPPNTHPPAHSLTHPVEF